MQVEQTRWTHTLIFFVLQRMNVFHSVLSACGISALMQVHKVCQTSKCVMMV